MTGMGSLPYGVVFFRSVGYGTCGWILVCDEFLSMCFVPSIIFTFIARSRSLWTIKSCLVDSASLFCYNVLLEPVQNIAYDTIGQGNSFDR